MYYNLWQHGSPESRRNIILPFPSWPCKLLLYAFLVSPMQGHYNHDAMKAYGDVEVQATLELAPGCRGVICGAPRLVEQDTKTRTSMTGAGYRTGFCLHAFPKVKRVGTSLGLSAEYSQRKDPHWELSHNSGSRYA